MTRTASIPSALAMSAMSTVCWGAQSIVSAAAPVVAGSRHAVNPPSMSDGDPRSWPSSVARHPELKLWLSTSHEGVFCAPTVALSDTGLIHRTFETSAVGCTGVAGDAGELGAPGALSSRVLMLKPVL